MSTEIAAYAPPAQSEIEYTWNLANKLCKTDFVPSNLRNKPEAVLAVFLTGRELGIGPMQSLRDIYPVNGRPALMASLMVARVRALGHKFTTLKSTDTEATVQIHRREETDPQPPVTFTQADARRAGLFDKAIWKQYPTAMHWNRAASAVCRRDCPEALGGAVYTPEEIEDGQATTATWGSPEGPPLPDEPPEQASDPATAVPRRGQAGSGITSEGPATRTDEAPGQPGRPMGRPSDDQSPEPNPPPTTAAGSGAPTSPVSPGDGKAGRGPKAGRATPGKADAPSDTPPAAPADEAAEQAAFEQTIADPDAGRFAR